MRHRLLIALLAFGTVAGYASGFASLSRRARCHAGWRAHATAPAPTCAPCPGAESPPPGPPR